MARSLSRPSSGGNTSLWIWPGIALVVIALDQFSKQLIAGGFTLGESRTVTSFFSVVRWHNTGTAFSLLADAAGWQRWVFVGLALAATLFIVPLLVRHRTQALFCFALAMVMGGALGNALDRLFRGYVVDFLLLHWRDAYTFPAFNLADSAITLGAICLLANELRRARQE